MRLQFGFHALRSKVARRLVATVALLVLAPAVMTGVISYVSVDARVRVNTETRLHEAARTYLLEIIGRLRIAASLLGDHLEGTARRNPNDTAGEVLDEISGGPVSGDLAGLPADLASAVRHLARDGAAGAVATVYRPTEETGAQVYLVMVGPAGIDQQYVTARVRRSFLWESAGVMPFRYGYCVTTGSGISLFCPAEAPFDHEGHQVPLAASTLSSPRETAHASAGDEEFTLRAWRAPVVAGLDALDIAVTVAAPASVAYSTQASFRESVGPSLGIAALSAILLAIVVIRRRLRPLDQLTAAASRMAAGDFSGAVRVDADDEFLGLASMFDDMRQRLGRQFAEMGLLARLDQGIARLDPLPRLVEALLSDLGQTFPGQKLLVAMPDGSAERRVSTFLLADGRVETGRCNVALDGLGESWRNEPEIGRAMGWPPGGAPDGVLVAWARESDRVIALIVADPPGRTDLSSELSRVMDQVADRISIAATEFRHRDRLYALGHYDDLTGLANRHLLRDRLRQWVTGAVPAETRGQLLFVDLDGFKRINDAEGHAVGDDLLREAARRLVDCTRERDTVARLGGDEFVVLATACPTTDDDLQLANRIVEQLQRPFRLGSSEHFLTASIGVLCVDSASGTNTDSLIGQADLAMYAAKTAGGNRAVLYRPEMQADAVRRAVDEAALREGVARNEFRLHYQPRLDLRTGALAGAEALLRWERPGAGLVPPGSFIALAEETGLIRDVGAWAIEEACRAYGRWIAQGLQLSEVSVNVSIRQVRDDDFVDRLARILAETGMPPGVLILEVTESLMAEDLVRASRRLQAIRSTGVRISIDDFGTGFSSLSYLREFPVDEIKVDRAFLNGVPGAANAERIVESIIQLGEALNKNVVVEGVERRDQFEFLRRVGCPQIQGYYLAKPLPEASFVEFALRPWSAELRSVA